jgi:hypothetical protein
MGGTRRRRRLGPCSGYRNHLGAHWAECSEDSRQRSSKEHFDNTSAGSRRAHGTG